MNRYCREFTYDKAFVLNILYDTLDYLSIKIDKANSIRGAILISSVHIDNEVKLKILLSPNPNNTNTVIEIIPVDNKDDSDNLVQSIYDGMNAVLVRAGVTMTV